MKTFEPEQSSKHYTHQEFQLFLLRLKALHEISSALSEMASLDDFCRSVIQLGRDKLGFDRLGLWFFDTDPRFAWGTFGTDEQGNIRDERNYRREAGFDEWPKTLFESGHIRAVSRDVPLYNHRSEIIGWGENAITFLWDGERRFGYMAADNLMRQGPLEDYQVELLALYGATVGQLLTRKRAEAALRLREESERQFQEKLRALHEASIELSKIHSFDDLCRRAVELGIGKLGFDRLGLWFIDPNDPHRTIGSFGTDEYGNVRDERSFRGITEVDEMVEVLDGRAMVSSRGEMPLFNHLGLEVGQGWKAQGKVWDGDRTIGWLSIDNLFSRQPFTDYQLELLALYAATVGHLAATRKAEEALTAERNLLRTIIDAIPDPIFVKNMASQFLLVNKAYWMGVPHVTSEEQIIGKTTFDLFPYDLSAESLADEQSIFQSGVALVNKEQADPDAERYYLTTKVPLKDSRGNVIGLAGVARDIADLKRNEKHQHELALERERVKVLHEFITNISHDLKTPLSIINTCLYVLERLTDPAAQKDKLDTIKQQTALLTHFIEEILTSARLESSFIPRRDRVNVSHLVVGVETSLCPEATQKNLTVLTQVQADVPDVPGDEVELERLLTNLVHNAIRYTPPGGSVTLRTYALDSQVVIEIADSGVGISEADLPHIFEHFFRADTARSMEKAGTGLGLAIAKRIAEVHDGTIEVESTIGQGTTFRVLLPVFQQDDA